VRNADCIHIELKQAGFVPVIFVWGKVIRDAHIRDE
jgi:hypothetical protein